MIGKFFNPISAGGGTTGYDVYNNIVFRFSKIDTNGDILLTSATPSVGVIKSISNNDIYMVSGFESTVNDIQIDSNGKIYLGGDFYTYQGTSANKMIRLNSDGSIDTNFVAGFNTNTVEVIKIDSNGKIYVGGKFTSYNGTSANKIIRLNSDGSIDTNFVYGTGFNLSVFDIQIDSNGKIYLCGEFSSYNGTSANKIIRLNSDGSIDTNFVYGTGFNTMVYSISVDSNDKIYVGGKFTSYNGTSANRIIRLNSDGSIDTNFVHGTGFNNDVNVIKIDSNGKIYVGGNFTAYK